jgi:hypothetical protein
MPCRIRRDQPTGGVEDRINAFKAQQKEIESLRARVRQLEDSVRKE